MSDEAAASFLPVPTFAPAEKVCGNCKLWQAHSIEERRGWVGPCRLQPSRGMFPPSAPICEAFVPRGSVVAFKVEAPVVARPLRSFAPVVRRREEATGPGPVPLQSTVPVELEGDFAMTRDELMDVFREASGQLDPPPLAAKWEGGVIQILPGKKELQGKELPIDSLFHKVVMVRDRLRVLEQKLNAHPKLSDAEKVEMQQYITRIYGSLTNFNILFRERDDHFVGAKGDE